MTLFCHAFVTVHSPMSMFLHAQQCFKRHLCQCIRQGSVLPCILLLLFVHLHSACVELALVSLCSLRSSVIHM